MAVSYAYIAGFWDGEGHISVHGNGHGYYKTEMFCTNTNLQVLIEIQKVTGGKIYSRESKQNPQWKTQHNLVLRSKEQRALLPLILEYLIVKREQAELLTGVWEKRISMKDALNVSKVLNRRGKEGGLAS